MIYFSDNDILLKLAAWNLIAEALAAINVFESEIYVLPTFHDQLKRRKRVWVEKYGESTIERALRFVERVTIIGDDLIDDAEVALLGAVPNLDSGEAVLFAATARSPDFLVFTGDKRCLYAVYQSETTTKVAARIRGRVLHLEQVIFRLVEKQGVNVVRDKVKSAPKVDLLISGAFGPRGDNSRDKVCAILLNSIRQLHVDCGELLSLSDTERPVF